MRRRPKHYLYQDTMQVGIVTNVAEKHGCKSDASELRAYQHKLNQFINLQQLIKLAETPASNLSDCILINLRVALCCIARSAQSGPKHLSQMQVTTSNCPRIGFSL